MLKSQNFEIIYKIKVKNWIVFYLVLSFHSNRIKVEAARAFAVFVRLKKIEFGILTALENRIRNSYSLPKSSRKFNSLEKFRSFNSLKFSSF